MSKYEDLTLALWVALCGALFLGNVIFGAEPHSAVKYVYVIVIAGCLAGMVIKLLRLVNPGTHHDASTDE